MIWDIPFPKLFAIVAIGLLVIYIAIRLITYAASKSWHQAKHEYNQLNNGEDQNGEKRSQEDIE